VEDKSATRAQPSLNSARPSAPSTKSEQAEADCAAPMGRGATATMERLAASLGQLEEAAPRFACALDIPKGGVLLALPALLVSGLLRHSAKYFRLPAGFYGLTSIFLLLAFMALGRLRSIEALRYYAPGEWGKLLGLDRAPEVRTLRIKLKHLADQEQAFSWSSTLCKEWMLEAPEEAAVLYVDGHVRVYHGRTKVLPKHYVARERLCLSATADYWVNAMDGKPFFVVSQAVDPGLLQVLERDIVPRLEADIPNQPGAEQLDADPLLHRFTVVFDREGYSPEFFAKMKKRRIACLTYHKYPGEDWPTDEFIATEARMASGQQITIRLAERGTKLSNGLWVREFRKLCESGHQTAFLSTDYRAPAAVLAPAMFGRWSQENFFRYMRQSFNLDGLVDYRSDNVPETIMVVNPAHRVLDVEVRKKVGLLNRRIAEFGALNLDGEIEPAKVEAYAQKKSDLQEIITRLKKDVDELKAQRKATQRHIAYKDLPADARFDRLSTQSKHLVDTIKMIAYRAETAMAQIVRQTMSRHDDARSLLRAVYSTEVDLIPDQEAKTLTVRLHPLANTSSDQVLKHLCAEINATETEFPGTELRLIYELVSAQSP
jgi:outer membrane murein-binding lipoprotein Lpp